MSYRDIDRFNCPECGSERTTLMACADFPVNRVRFLCDDCGFRIEESFHDCESVHPAVRRIGYRIGEHKGHKEGFQAAAEQESKSVKRLARLGAFCCIIAVLAFAFCCMTCVRAHAIEPPADLEEMPLLVNDEEGWIVFDEPIEYAIKGEFDPMDESDFIKLPSEGIPSSEPRGGLPKTGDKAPAIAAGMVLLFAAGVCAVRRGRM